MTSLSAGAVPAAGTAVVVAFYDPESGAVRFAHSIHVLAGGTAPDGDPVAEARRIAERFGCRTDGLEVAVSTRAEHGQLPHRVDPRTGAFEAMPTRAPRR